MTRQTCVTQDPLIVTFGYVLSPVEYQEFKRYEQIRGIPIDTAIGEALSDYIECCIKTRLEGIQAKLHLA